MEPRDLPCDIISSWTPPANCTTYGMSVYRSGGVLQYNTSWQEYFPKCVAVFNITTNGTYHYNSSVDEGVIVVQSEDNMTSLGVIIFLLLLNGVLFAAPFFVAFTDDEVTNNIIKKIVWIAGLLILAFNTTILASLAENAGLGITQELFVFQWIFIKALYICMILLFFNIMTSTPKLWKAKEERKRMGEEE